VLVHDFWAAYDAIGAADHQCCLAHLLRELEKVDDASRKTPSNGGKGAKEKGQEASRFAADPDVH